MPLNIKALPKDYPRQFIPEALDPGDLSQLKRVFDELERRDISRVSDLEQWLLDWSELAAIVSSTRKSRYVRMTLQTDDETLERDYLAFIENIQPGIKQANFRLQKKYASSPAREVLSRERYHVLDRSIANQVNLFREENIDLETEESKLSQRYEKRVGGMAVTFRGQVLTISQVAAFLENTDRNTRQRAWEQRADRYLQEQKALDGIFDEMVSIRQQIAHNAGYESYRDYIFSYYERFDYTPEDCYRFHEAVEKYIVPLRRELDEQRRQTMALDRLRPWDLEVDPEGRAPLKPFETADQLLAGCQAIFERMDSELASDFRRMVDLDLLDIESRKGKAPGGYQSSLDEQRLPFIFMNAVGRQLDLVTLLHEAGHAFHAFACRDEPLYFYRYYPSEFAEVASMSMELLAAKYWDEFYAPEQAARARHDHLLYLVVNQLTWVATIDAFQHWVYTHPDHSHSERDEAWLDIRQRFGGIESWSGYEEAERKRWHRQLHPFTVPFYYIEYGIARLGSLGIWARSHEDYPGAIRSYKEALALGGSRPLPELFETAGIRFDFGDETMSRISQALRQDLLKRE